MTDPVDISHLSVQQLLTLRQDIDSQVASRREAEITQLRADVLELCSSRGYTLQEVMAPFRKKPNGKAEKGVQFVKGTTYRNPGNPSQTWQGFGQRPTWIRDHLANGGSVASLEAEPVAGADAAAPTPTASTKKPAAKTVNPAAKLKKP